MLTTAMSEDAGTADRVLHLPDGRRLGYREFGDPAGYPVIALHGTPGSRFKYAGSHAAAAARGLRLIAPDRWGYGMSSRKEGARLRDYADDVKALADALGIGAFHVTGVSGGGPFAVAVAARLSERVTGVALVSPVGLISGPAGRSRLSPFHWFCFRVMPLVPGALTATFHAYRSALSLAPNMAMWLAVSRSPAVDRAAVRDQATRKRLVKTFSTGLTFSVRGPAADIELFSKPWDLDFSAVTAPVRIWIGTADRNVPVTAVMALHDALPGSECTLLPGEGHLWVALHGEDVLHWLALLPRPIAGFDADVSTAR